MILRCTCSCEFVAPSWVVQVLHYLYSYVPIKTPLLHREAQMAESTRDVAWYGCNHSGVVKMHNMPQHL